LRALVFRCDTVTTRGYNAHLEARSKAVSTIVITMNAHDSVPLHDNTKQVALKRRLFSSKQYCMNCRTTVHLNPVPTIYLIVKMNRIYRIIIALLNT